MGSPNAVATGKTVLIVDDDEDLRELIATQMQRLGYMVLSADNDADAMRMIAAHPEIALMITDLTLPDNVSGSELAERALENLPGLEILYMSGCGEEAIGRHFKTDPGTRYLQKPFTLAALRLQVQTVLRSA